MESAVKNDTAAFVALPYMPPEQLKYEDVDARGDVFAFGATLPWETWTPGT
jgi:hypothetical protein